mmetsp:Transcript_103741/g.293243  ORF Transcript_103741/g.293243 Transcript_103741/m.293243 type:complete len:333 (-) Transcript_103741:88-1086(-)
MDLRARLQRTASRAAKRASRQTAPSRSRRQPSQRMSSAHLPRLPRPHPPSLQGRPGLRRRRLRQQLPGARCRLPAPRAASAAERCAQARERSARATSAAQTTPHALQRLPTSAAATRARRGPAAGPTACRRPEQFRQHQLGQGPKRSRCPGLRRPAGWGRRCSAPARPAPARATSAARMARPAPQPAMISSARASTGSGRTACARALFLAWWSGASMPRLGRAAKRGPTWAWELLLHRSCAAQSLPWASLQLQLSASDDAGTSGCRRAQSPWRRPCRRRSRRMGHDSRGRCACGDGFHASTSILRRLPALITVTGPTASLGKSKCPRLEGSS